MGGGGDEGCIRLLLTFLICYSHISIRFLYPRHYIILQHTEFVEFGGARPQALSGFWGILEPRSEGV